MRHDGGNALKSQDNRKGLRAPPRNSVECGKVYQLLACPEYGKVSLQHRVPCSMNAASWQAGGQQVQYGPRALCSAGVSWCSRHWYSEQSGTDPTRLCAYQSEKETAMPLGYRHFVVVGDDITPLSQKAFEALFRQQYPGLPAFAGTTVDLVTIVYVVEHRCPTALARMDGERWTIRDDGTLDAHDREDRVRLTRYQMDRAFRHVLPSAPHTVAR